MANEKLVHDLIVDHMKKRLSRDYNDIRINTEGNPDLVLSNHGLVLAVVEVETESSITTEQADEWASLLEPGRKLILMVPKNSKVKTTEILWNKGLAGKVAVGTYDIVITMP